jgi:hypothetical protein
MNESQKRVVLPERARAVFDQACQAMNLGIGTVIECYDIDDVLGIHRVQVEGYAGPLMGWSIFLVVTNEHWRAQACRYTSDRLIDEIIRVDDCNPKPRRYVVEEGS